MTLLRILTVAGFAMWAIVPRGWWAKLGWKDGLGVTVGGILGGLCGWGLLAWSA